MMFQLILIAFQICIKVYVEYISDEEEHAGGDDELGGLEESWQAGAGNYPGLPGTRGRLPSCHSGGQQRNSK